MTGIMFKSSIIDLSKKAIPAVAPCSHVFGPSAAGKFFKKRKDFK